MPDADRRGYILERTFECNGRIPELGHTRRWLIQGNCRCRPRVTLYVQIFSFIPFPGTATGDCDICAG